MAHSYVTPTTSHRFSLFGLRIKRTRATSGTVKNRVSLYCSTIQMKGFKERFRKYCSPLWRKVIPLMFFLLNIRPIGRESFDF